MKKLFVVRNDKLGDLILILPALKLIKTSCVDIQIDCLLDKKYSEISSITKYIDNTIYDDINLVSVINDENYTLSNKDFKNGKVKISYGKKKHGLLILT